MSYYVTTLGATLKQNVQLLWSCNKANLQNFSVYACQLRTVSTYHPFKSLSPVMENVNNKDCIQSQFESHRSLHFNITRRWDSNRLVSQNNRKKVVWILSGKIGKWFKVSYFMDIFSKKRARRTKKISNTLSQLITIQATWH